MSVQLEISDGSPHWWASLDIWTVPGDPSGAPGLPVVGEQCFLYARVTNNGGSAVQNATVRFYWANPSVGFDRTTANHIGDANVSLDAGETQEVLCLVPWIPVFVNGGHECVLAEAFHPTADPLPATPVFNVPTDRHVAQRNLSVLMVAPKQKMFSMAFEVCNTQRLERTFEIVAEQGSLKELRPAIKQLGLDSKIANLKEGKLTNVGFTHKPNPCMDEEEMQQAGRKSRMQLQVAPNICQGLSVVGELEGDIALVNVVQYVDKKEVGGLSFVVLCTQEGREKK